MITFIRNNVLSAVVWLITTIMTYSPVNYITAVMHENKIFTSHLPQQQTNEIAWKDVVIIGNGPSGIALSYMLDGNLPFYNGLPHPDEMISTRLGFVSMDRSLAEQDLSDLSEGLEGRSKNPVSLLIDALEHPYADLGMEFPSLIEWRHDENKKIDHIVLGKGPPGGSWHKMDPNILTLSLGSWMALPGLPYNSGRDSRTSAGQVAKYYTDYVNTMDLGKYFRNSVIVTSVKPVVKCCKSKNRTENAFLNKIRCSGTLDATIKRNLDFSSSNKRRDDSANERNLTFNDNSCDSENIFCDRSDFCNEDSNTFIVDKNTNENFVAKCDIDDRENNFTFGTFDKCNDNNDEFVDRNETFEESIANCNTNFNETFGKIETSSCFGKCDKITKSETSNFQNYSGNKKFLFTKSRSCDFYQHPKMKNKHKNSDNKYLFCNKIKKSPTSYEEMDVDLPTDKSHERLNIDCECENSWLVEGYEQESGERFVYFTKNVILATGSNDTPNRLGIQGEMENKSWLLHDLRDLEDALDKMTEEERSVCDPVMVIGAGLSAADAIIASRFRSIPVLHVFRRRNVALDKQLPENMYPEYHKVHRMMSNGGLTYPYYTSLPEHNLVEVHPENKKVKLINHMTGAFTVHQVSFVVVLIGSRPDLSFLSPDLKIGQKKSQPIDSKTNPANINPFTHKINNQDGLYALGPLAGDHFVRFISGGALAITSDLLERKKE